MRLTPALLALALAVVSGPAVARDEPSVPEPFRGIWRTDVGACDRLLEGIDPGHLVISPRRIAAFRSSGPVIDVRAGGAREIIVVALLEGHWEPRERRSFSLRLSDDEARLTEIREGASVVRERCRG